MRKSALRLTSVALAAGFAGIALFSVGCGNPQEQADSALAAKIAQADKDRGDASTPKKLDVVQGEYDTAAKGAASDALVSLQMKALAKSRDAQLRYERAMVMVSELRDKELVITRNIITINQMASQIQGSQAYVESLKKFDPAQQIATLKEQAANIQQAPGGSYAQPIGDAEHPDAKVMIPSVEKLKSEIDELTDKIAKTKAAIEALHKQSAEAIDQNETLSRKLESETGDVLVTDSTQAAKLRQNAADDDAQAETLRAAQARLEADLAMDQAQKGAVDGTSETVLGQIKSLEDAWGIIQKQIDSEKEMQQKLIAATAEGQSKEASSIVAHVTELSSQLTAAAALREETEKELKGAIDQFKSAAKDAGAAYLTLQNLTVTRPDNADKPVWKQELETMYPGSITLLQATAMGSLVSVESAKVVIDKRIEEMFDGYGAVSGLSVLLTTEKTGIDTPKEVSDLLKLSVTKDQLPAEVSEINTAFTDSIAVYTPGATDLTMASKDRAPAGFMGKAVTEREWAQFDLLIDAPAQEVKTHLAAADEAELAAQAADSSAGVAATPSPTTFPSGR